MKRVRPPLFFLLAMFIFGAGFAGIALAELPMPYAAGAYTYPPVVAPVVNGQPESARPMGTGSDPRHQLALTLGLDSFPGPVDVYLGIQAPAVSPEIFLVTTEGGLSPLSAALTPFRAGVKGPLNESPFGAIPIPLSVLPSGDYNFFCLVTPAGTLTGGYYLWVTSVANLKAADLSATAVGLFGGDAEAATAILMALARGYSLNDVAAAINAGTLNGYGEITAVGTRSMNSLVPEPRAITDVCDTDVVTCRAAMLATISLWQAELLLKNDVEGNLFAKYTITTLVLLQASDQGYSPSRIRSMTNRELLADLSQATVRVTEACNGTEASGVCRDGRKTAAPDNDPPGIFSDVTPAPAGGPAPVPGLEGMTFPAYFKGTGSYWEYYSNPNSGVIECSTENAVYLAQVGGTGIWDGLLKVYITNYPHHNSGAGELECRTDTYTLTVAKGLYSENGTYHGNPSGDTYSATIDVLFNKDHLWGNAWSTENIPVYGGDQVTQRQFEFNLQPVTEAEYKAMTAH